LSGSLITRAIGTNVTRGAVSSEIADAVPTVASVWESCRMRRIRAIVSGRVQGVSYRAATCTEARRLGVVGWVKNRDDGSVELEAEGPDDMVAALIQWCHQGPPAALVARVTVDDITPSGANRDFEIAY
jgi:acylphosphatase